MKAIPAGPRVESNIGQYDTKRRSERRFQGDVEANSAHSDVYSFGFWETQTCRTKSVSSKTSKNSVKLFKVGFRVGESTVFLEQ